MYNIHWDLHAHTHAWMHRYWFAIVLPHHVSKPIEIQHISKFGYPSRYGVFPDSFCNSGFWSERPSYAQSVVWYWYHALWFCRNHVQFTLCSFACLFCGAYVFVVITTTQESHSVDTSHVVQLPRFLPAWHLQHSWKGLPTMPHGPIFFVFWANGMRWMLAGHFQWPEWVSHLWMSGLARMWSISLPSMSGVIVLGSIKQTSSAEQVLFALWGMSYWELPQFSRRHSTGWLSRMPSRHQWLEARDGWVRSVPCWICKPCWWQQYMKLACNSIGYEKISTDMKWCEKMLVPPR